MLCPGSCLNLPFDSLIEWQQCALSSNARENFLTFHDPCTCTNQRYTPVNNKRLPLLILSKTRFEAMEKLVYIFSTVCFHNLLPKLSACNVHLYLKTVLSQFNKRNLDIFLWKVNSDTWYYDFLKVKTFRMIASKVSESWQNWVIF